MTTFQFHLFDDTALQSYIEMLEAVQAKKTHASFVASLLQQSYAEQETRVNSQLTQWAIPGKEA